MSDNFVHLHGHSHYSALDGFSQTKKIVEHVKKIGQSAIAVTDHGNINGAYKFYTECKKQGIKPIMGIEIYAVEEYLNQKKLYHITILAKDNIGWGNILKLHKISHQNFYYKPRIDFNDLFTHRNGLVVLSGCPSGVLSRHIRENDRRKANSNCELFRSAFGDDFYIELMSHDISFQKELNHNLEDIARRNNIDCVVTNDYHYIEKRQAVYQNYLMCDNLKVGLNDEKKIGLATEEFYIKTRDEMPGTDKQKDLTIEIANKCNVNMEFKGFLLPVIENEEHKVITIVKEGMKKFGFENNEEYKERLNLEFNVIKEAGFLGYFLTVWDYIKWCRDNDILVGPGRGSVGGCLLAYFMGIHTVDPIKHKLLFSRFYNAGRKGSLPDIDIDFPENKIHLVREYVRKKYGQEKVSHIGTYTYLQNKSALKLLCRVLGVNFSLANQWSKAIDDEKLTKRMAEQDPNFADIIKKIVEFKGLATNSSIHAAGILISPINLENLIPLRINKENGIYISNWDMKDVESIGLVKYDFLSLNTLDVIQDTLKAINMRIEDIPTNDLDTFAMMTNTSNVGIFQLSSDGISGLANEMQISTIDDIAAVVALYRPGPINSGLHHKYIKRKNGSEAIEYAHPLLEEVLKDTYGVWVYQEQVIEAVMVLAGFSEIEADLMRKAIGKKIPELMKEQKDKFLIGCDDNNIDRDISQPMWEEIEEFAEYSFNRAHSVEYAYISYYTAYLKTHYPYQFMCSILNNNYDKQEKLAIYLKECKAMGIEVMPPSITKGSYNFKVEDYKIIFGLKGIKGVGENTARKIYKQKYESFEDFCVKFRPSSDITVAFAESGVFDEFEYNRNQIIQSALSIGEVLKKNKIRANPKAKTLIKNKPDFHIVEIEELSNEILASKEYSRLKVYLVHDPLEGVELATPEALEDGAETFIEGYLINIREFLTKRKSLMAFLTIATNLGQIEGIVFPQMYAEKQSTIKKDTYIAIEGKVEQNKIKIKNIWSKM